MRERQRHKLPCPVHIEPGDVLICSVEDKKKKYKFRETIGRRLTVDTIITFDVDEPMLGLGDGIGAIFGEAD